MFLSIQVFYILLDFIFIQQIDVLKFRGRRKSSQKLAKRITLVSFSTPSLPHGTNGNRKTGLNAPLRKGSEDFDFPELCKMTVHSRVNRKQQTVEKWKITNHAEERKSLEGEIEGNVRITVSNEPIMFEKDFFMWPFELKSICSRARRSAACVQCNLRATHFFYFEACFVKTVETPSLPNERSSFRKLCKLLRAP